MNKTTTSLAIMMVFYAGAATDVCAFANHLLQETGRKFKRMKSSTARVFGFEKRSAKAG
jgi:hypothetical protein